MTGVNHDSCAAFRGMKCPAQKGAPPTGDVPVPIIILWALTLYPDPTEDKLPLFVYDENPVQWFYNESVQYPQKYKYTHYNSRKLLQGNNADPSGATIAIHIDGQDIKGPEEAEGVNIDLRFEVLFCFTLMRNL